MIETEQHLGHSLKKLHFLMEQTMNRRLLELDLTTAQGHIIGCLIHAPEPPCVRDLETAFGLTHATISGILSRMEDKGFISLHPDPHDRRIKRVSLTDKGAACSKEICRRIHETEQTMVQGFTEAELAQLRGLLQRSIQNLNESERSNP